MLTLRVVSRRHLPCVKYAFYQAHNLATKAKVKSDLMADFKQHLPAAKVKLSKREPFAKNLFVGKFDTEFLAYPEPQSPDRYNEFEEWLKPIEEYMKTVNPKEFETTDSIPPHVLQKLTEFRVLGARISKDYNGMELLNTEFLRLLEVIGRVPALGLFLLKQGVGPIDILSNFASVEQKMKYLPKISLNQSLASVAITETDNWTAVNQLRTNAVLSEDDKYWILDGEKTFVANSTTADTFIVYAHALMGGITIGRPENMSAFIIDKGTEGLIIPKDYIRTIGLKGFHSGRVVFKNIKLPRESMIGEVGDGTKHLIHLFSQHRHFIAALLISLTRNHLNLLRKDVLSRKYFHQNLYETDAAKKAIANITNSIYNMESVLYLTTSLIDLYDEQDLMLETALVEQFCVEECLRAIQDSMWVIGPRACTLVQPYEQILRDAFTLTNYETSLIDTKIYTALLGIQHFGLVMADKIKKDRNPLFNPKHILSKIFGEEKSLKLHLEEYLHPSLMDCADFCDRCLFKLKTSTDNLLVQHGLDVMNKHSDLFKISDMAALIYTYIGVLSRASRSYCIGNRDAESEIKLCIMMAYRMEQKIDQLAEEIKHSEYATGEYLNKEIAQQNYIRKEYIAAHPLKRNY